MKTQSCEQCQWPALLLHQGLCQPCRLRGGDVIEGHILAAKTTEPKHTTVIVCSRSSGCEIVQLPLG